VKDRRCGVFTADQNRLEIPKYSNCMCAEETDFKYDTVEDVTGLTKAPCETTRW